MRVARDRGGRRGRGGRGGRGLVARAAPRAPRPAAQQDQHAPQEHSGQGTHLCIPSYLFLALGNAFTHPAGKTGWKFR